MSEHQTYFREKQINVREPNLLSGIPDKCQKTKLTFVNSKLISEHQTYFRESQTNVREPNLL